MPQPADGGVLDTDLVVVEYEAGGIPPGQKLTQGRRRMAMCTTVQADVSAQVNILLGCQGS